MNRAKSRCATLLASALVLGPLATGAAADETLVLRSGKTFTGEVAEVGGAVVKFRTEGALLTVEFAQVEPGSLYKLLAPRTDAKNAEARFQLGETCARYGAYEEARGEFEAARSLDASFRDRVEARLREVYHLQAQGVYNQGLEAMLAADWTKAVDAFRFVADKFAESEWAEKAKELQARALAELEKAEAQKKAAPAAPAPAAGSGPTAPATASGAPEVKRRLTREEAQKLRIETLVKTLRKKAEDWSADADKKNREGLEWDAKGNVTRASRGYEEAVDLSLRAKNALGKTAGVQYYATDLAVLEEAQKKTEAINAYLVLVYLNLANLHTVQRNFERGWEYVNLALQLDPTNKRALDLKQKITEQRIVRKASDMTNARPKVSGG
ncbi:MAG: hypothetical protein L0216_20265 [Planctomycetales bacterium]|nr:hypothetical protein [Planctomycetales bacterium]